MKQFSIRDLLLAVLVIALGLGWWLDKRTVPGRFQMGNSTSNGMTYVLDTSTGQVWHSSDGSFFARKDGGK